MKSKITAIRSNPMPAQGSAATQPIAPNQSPASVEELVDYLTPAISRFRSVSSPLTVALDAMSFGSAGVTGSALGDSKQTRIASVGLGERVLSYHSAVINLANAGGGAQTVTFSAHFPWNLLANTAIQINGGETTYSTSGRGGLAVWARDRCGFFTPYAPGGNGLGPAIVQMTAGANLTLNLQASTTAAFTTLSGGNTVSIAAGTNGNLTVNWITVEKLAHSRSTLLGALPLQNNSTYATITRQVASTLVTTSSTNQQVPLYNAGANVTATLSSYTVAQQYNFWGIPTDPSVYQPLIENSYQVLEQKSLTANATGTLALVYNIPQNLYATAAHFFLNDGNGVPLTVPTALTRLVVQYNAGSIVPVTQFPERTRAAQFADYDGDLGLIPGYRLWDGNNTSELVNISDEAGWVDTYAAAEPQIGIDLLSSLTTPITYHVTREAIVAGAVQQLGG